MAVIVKGIHYPEKATLHFIYGDNSRTVIYAFKVDKSFYILTVPEVL